MFHCTLALLLAFTVTTRHLCLSRDVPAKMELCRRYNLGCHSAKEANTTVPVISHERDRSKQQNYCGMYEPHFLYFCIGENPGGNRHDIEKFCYAYRNRCALLGDQQSSASSSTERIAFSPEKCDQYGAVAITVCTGREQGHTRQLCDLYKQICKPGSPKHAVLHPEGRLQLCKKYAPLTRYVCSTEGYGQAAELCNLYRAYCSELLQLAEDLRGVFPGPPSVGSVANKAVPHTTVPNQASVMHKEVAQHQSSPPASASIGSGVLVVTPEGVGLSSLTPEHLAHLCKQYAPLVKSKCNGNLQGQLRQLCEMYKVYCGELRETGAHVPERPVHIPEAAAVNLRPSSTGHVGTTSPAEGTILCKQYEQMANTLCTGKEEGKLRQACEVYRAHCLSAAQAPFADQHTVAAISGTSPAGFGATGFLPLMSRILPHHLLYCKKFLVSFAKFCLRRPPTDALFFCLAYGERCFPGVFNSARIAAASQQPIWAAYGAPGSWDIPLLCLNFKDISERYCTGYEPEFIREYCNVYRTLKEQLCDRYGDLPTCRQAAKLSEAGSSLVEAPSLTDQRTYCQQFRANFAYFCLRNSQESVKKDVQNFCLTYKAKCLTGTPASPVPNPFQAPSLNAQPSATKDEIAAQPAGGGLGGSNQVGEACGRYDRLAQQHCNGNEQGQMRLLCQAYRRMCTGRLGGQLASVGPPESEQASFCRKNSNAYMSYCIEQAHGHAIFFCRRYAEQCAGFADRPATAQIASQLASQTMASEARQTGGSVQPGEDTSLLCEKFRFIADKVCVGFEAQHVREYCNVYRIYCLNERPYPIVDGNIGVTTDAWGVSGIPFYPFNPQGAIGGGKRVGVGYGDWGARVTTQKGVSDFWDQGRVVNANWQRGIYGPARGWGVPLIGIGGFRSDIVKTSGLAAPADWPALRSGGVPPPALPPDVVAHPFKPLGLSSLEPTESRYPTGLGASAALPSLAGGGLLEQAAAAAQPPIRGGGSMRMRTYGTTTPDLAVPGMVVPATQATEMAIPGIGANGMGMPQAGLTGIAGTSGRGLGGMPGISPIGIGQSSGVGLGGMPLFGQTAGTSIDPSGSVSGGRGWGAGPVSGFSGGGVNFGGIPFLG